LCILLAMSFSSGTNGNQYKWQKYFVYSIAYYLIQTHAVYHHN